MKMTRLGLDLAKNVIHMHAVNARDEVMVRRAFTRQKLMAYMQSLEPCVVGMEACAGAHHWAQCLTSFAVKNQAMGHRVVLIVLQHVKRYVLGQKNDANDAAGICEAITRCVFPTLRSKPKRSKIFKPYIVFALR